LAATAAPKLSEMSEGAKQSKSMNEIDKILTQAQNFYNDTAELEGRGRFPGQDKFDVAVGGHTNIAAVVADIGPSGTFTSWNSTDGSDWRSVFGVSNADAGQAAGGKVSNDTYASGCPTCPGTKAGNEEWLTLFAGNTLASKYQDGHLIYVVVAGGGSGTDATPPVLFVADAENPRDFNALLEP